MLFSELGPLEQWIAHEEGYRSDLHVCPAGFLSVGFGYNLEAHLFELELSQFIQWAKQGCSRTEATILLRIELRLLAKRLRRLAWFGHLSIERQDAVLCMGYQLGFDGLNGFVQMIAALRAGDFERAADEMLNSKWARSDSPARARRVAKVMRSGVAVTFAGEPAGWSTSVRHAS